MSVWTVPEYRDRVESVVAGLEWRWTNARAGCCTAVTMRRAAESAVVRGMRWRSGWVAAAAVTGGRRTTHPRGGFTRCCCVSSAGCGCAPPAALRVWSNSSPSWSSSFRANPSASTGAGAGGELGAGGGAAAGGGGYGRHLHTHAPLHAGHAAGRCCVVRHLLGARRTASTAPAHHLLGLPALCQTGPRACRALRGESEREREGGRERERSLHTRQLVMHLARHTQQRVLARALTRTYHPVRRPSDPCELPWPTWLCPGEHREAVLRPQGGTLPRQRRGLLGGERHGAAVAPPAHGAAAV